MNTFRDSLDPTRFLRPVHEMDAAQPSTKCHVYFKESNHTPALYHGTTTVPTRMLLPTCSDPYRASANERVGFCLVATIEAPPSPEKKKKVVVEDDEDDEFDDRPRRRRIY